MDLHTSADRIAQVQWLLACFIAYPSYENQEALLTVLADYQSEWNCEQIRLMGSACNE